MENPLRRKTVFTQLLQDVEVKLVDDFKALKNEGVTKIKTREPKIYRPLLITSRSIDYAIKMSKIAEGKGHSPFVSKQTSYS